MSNESWNPVKKCFAAMSEKKENSLPQDTEQDGPKKIEFFSIVIPVYNEEETLEELIERTITTAASTGRRFELILVDDGSSDRSPRLLEEAARKHSQIVVVNLHRNSGQHAAVTAGFEVARGDAVITLDADLQNPPEEIVNVLAELDKGMDVVGTRRVDRQDTMFRKVASAITNRAVQKTTGVYMNDYGCMLRGYSRATVDAMRMCNERNTFIPVLANYFARQSTEIAVQHNERPAGESKYSFWKLISLQLDLLTCMTTVPLRFLTVMGGIIAAAGFGFAILLFVLRLVHGPEWAAEGVFTLFAILFIFIGAQFVALGILGEYIGRIYDSIRARPPYIIERIIRQGAVAYQRESAQQVPGKESAGSST